MRQRRVECGNELSNFEFRELFLHGFNVWFSWPAPTRCLPVWLEDYALPKQQFNTRNSGQTDDIGRPVFVVEHID